MPLFRKKGPTGAAVRRNAAAAGPPASSSDGDGSQESRDRIANLLRLLGKHAFDLSDMDTAAINKAFESWARHVLIGDTRPRGGGEGHVDIDWRGMLRFVSSHRKKEKSYVDQSMDDFRQVVWAFVHAFSRSMHDDRDSDETTLTQLKRLQSAVGSKSLESIKHEAIAAISVISESIDQKERRRNDQIRELGSQIGALRDQLREADLEMSLDPVTHLHNRQALEDFVFQTLDLSLFAGHDACLLMVDVDHFAAIRESHGHIGGDEILRQIADCCIRSFPRKNDFVARSGGKELTVVLCDVAVEKGAELAHRFLEMVRLHPFKVNKRTVPVTVSIGLTALYPNDSCNTWMSRCRESLARAKADGMNCVVVGRLPAKSSHPRKVPTLF